MGESVNLGHGHGRGGRADERLSQAGFALRRQICLNWFTEIGFTGALRKARQPPEGLCTSNHQPPDGFRSNPPRFAIQTLIAPLATLRTLRIQAKNIYA
ncbi:hypothetical protein AVEN_60426-1 [Araneus ventricosus]|uniref:Uncharacterized protein n=1 Tax=Araneus ventricosus TaxID=182803 RepID=A0A4Y2TSB9_ARAVE|nr:hypothetical protein AVEN_264167-1 [Araneus ventricosus]GBO03545.1 hypothetical protein AVEN_60426-1 [Araneus ventricosus]